MNIIWFSEIKWDYLKTRKQQILSRFPESSSIYFFEPISKALPNHYCSRNFDHVKAVTIPQIRTVSGVIINLILSFSFIRTIINALAGLWFKIYFSRKFYKTDIIITSNVFWAKTIRRLKENNPNVPIIYDCNDNPLGFPGSPEYTKYYFLETLNLADKIIIPHTSYINFIPENFRSEVGIIANGVDYELFQKSVITPQILKKIKKPIIMYIGAISEWFNFQLIKAAAKKAGYNFLLVGPISTGVEVEMSLLKSIENIFHFPSIPHMEIPNYLSKADVCIIPFIKNKLTESVLPNKLFEYAAAGKNCVLTNFNPSLSEFSEYVSIASDTDKFIFEIVNQVNKPRSSDFMKKLAKNYDWRILSTIYYDCINSILKKDI